MDVVLPRMGDQQVAEGMAQTQSGITAFLSGDIDDAVVCHGVLVEVVAFLQKPFTPSALAQKVREVLNR